MIHEAIKTANRSTHRRFKTGAVIVSRKGEILSRGWSHTGMKLYNLLSIHSETHALWRARHLDLNGTSIYIATISGRNGNVTTGKPCVQCGVMLDCAGIEKVYYSLPGGDYTLLDIEEELRDYSVSNFYGKKGWEAPDWAVPKRRR